MDENERVIFEFKKNQREIVRAIRKRYANHEYLDLRTYYPDESGNWKPNGKGLMLKLELLPNLEEAVTALKKADNDR